MVWDHSTFSKNRERLLEGDIAAKLLSAVLSQPGVKRLLSTDHFSIDGTLVEAWASMKSFRPKDGEPPAPGGGRNRGADFHGQKRGGERLSSFSSAKPVLANGRCPNMTRLSTAG